MNLENKIKEGIEREKNIGSSSQKSSYLRREICFKCPFNITAQNGKKLASLQ